MWHIPSEGCKITVKGDVNDVLTVSCKNGSDVSDYHCAVTQRGLLMLFVKHFDDVHYYDGRNAVQTLKGDLVWDSLPDQFRAMVNDAATSLTKRR
jgi:hypothetical protein